MANADPDSPPEAGTRGREEATAAEPRLDYVSPLPPVRSGIADYSADLLPHLARRCDLRVIQLPGQAVSDEVKRRWRPAPARQLGEGGRIPLYHMGNNRYHREVERLALLIPGVLTLHDLVLHHHLLDHTMGEGEFEPYRQRLTADHGWMGEAAAMPRRWGGYGDAAHFALPAHRTLLRRQRGVLVHSRWAAELLHEEELDLRVEVVPMGVPLPPELDEAAASEFRRRRGIPEDRPLLGSFGFQTPIKRTDTAIAALAAPELAEVHLLIAGEVAPILDLERPAREAGVADRVHITGFLSSQEFQQAIAATDLCLNLRYPTAGETSASLLRVLATGRAAVVSDYAQFAALPAEVAVKVPLGDGEVSALVSCLAALLRQPERLRHMGHQARSYVEREHDPETAATAVVAACRQLGRLSPPASRPVAQPIPTNETWSHLPGRLEVEGWEPPWAPGERRRLHLRLTNTGFARWLSGDRGTGGVALELQLLARRGNLLARRPWLPLPRDLGPGETCTFEAEIRRPLGSVRLKIEPHIFGHSGLGALRGPVWEREI